MRGTLHTGASALAAGALAAACLTAQAQEYVSHELPLALAMDAASAAVAACEAAGHRVTVTVLDRAGQLKVVAKGDRATPHTPDSSRGKAYTVVTLGPIVKLDTSAEIAARIRENPAAAPLNHVPGILLLAGAVAIKLGDEMMGAIGVGGAPGGQLDEACAKAGLEKIAPALKAMESLK